MSYHKLFSNTPNLITKLQSNGYHCYATIDSGMTEIGFNAKFENNDVGNNNNGDNINYDKNNRKLDDSNKKKKNRYS